MPTNDIMGSYVYDMGPTRILAVLERARRARLGELSYPQMVIINPINTCNSSCKGCEYEKALKSGKDIIDSPRLYKLLDELKSIGAKAVEFSGGGEPTMFKDLKASISRAKEIGLSAGLITNGILLRDELMETAARGLSYVRVSIDAADDKTYRKVRTPENGVFENVLNNIRELLKYRSACGSSVLVSIKFLVSKLNANQLREAVMMAVELGVDSIQFKALRKNQNEIGARQSKSLDCLISELKSENRVKVTGGVKKISCLDKCWLTPIQTTVDARGNVYLCNYYLHRETSHCIGNIYDNTFNEIWVAPRHALAIKGINSEECNFFDCRFVTYMDIMKPVVDDKNRQIDFL